MTFKTIWHNRKSHWCWIIKRFIGKFFTWLLFQDERKMSCRWPISFTASASRRPHILRVLRFLYYRSRIFRWTLFISALNFNSIKYRFKFIKIVFWHSFILTISFIIIMFGKTTRFKMLEHWFITSTRLERCGYSLYIYHI